MSDTLLEIYKLQAEMADRVTQRRQNSNQFYIGILTAIFVLFSIVTGKDFVYNSNPSIISASLCIFGILICIVWLQNINSLKVLNSAKFRALQEIEAQLPYQFYAKERTTLKANPKYKSQSRIEKNIPVLFIVFYSIALILSIAQFLWL